jgi:hypothetical protein
MMQARTAQIKALIRERSPNIPDDISKKLDSLLDEMLKTYPVETILNNSVPVYQKHFTSTDVAAMVAFYSTATGQKVVRQLPVILAESVQASQQTLQSHMQMFNPQIQELMRETMEQMRPQPPSFVRDFKNQYPDTFLYSQSYAPDTLSVILTEWDRARRVPLAYALLCWGAAVRATALLSLPAASASSLTPVSVAARSPNVWPGSASARNRFTAS